MSGKIDVIENLLGKVDTLLLGGGMAYTFFLAQGEAIGHSLVEEDKLDVARRILDKAEALGVKLLLPIDTVVADDFRCNSQYENRWAWRNRRGLGRVGHRSQNVCFVCASRFGS